MKKIFIIISLFCSFATSAQVYQNDPSYGRSIERYEVRKDLGIPTFCGEPTVNSTVTNKAKIAYDSCAGIFYIFNPKVQSWYPFSGSTTTLLQDGLLSGAEVTWTGDSTAFFIQAGTFRKFGEFYTTNDTTIILDRPNDLYGRIDLIVFDTTNGGQIRKVTGELSPTPIEPQVADYQIKLTTGISFSAGSTTPSNVSVSLIYDENVEWTAGHTGTMTVNFNNTSTVYHGSKSAFVSSYGKNSALTFTGTSQTVGTQTLSLWVNLVGQLNNSFAFQFFNGTTSVSAVFTVRNTYGLNPNTVGTYQNITIPLSSFSWTGTTFDKLVIMQTGPGNWATPGFYLDYLQLQNGIATPPPASDYSNKVDSTTTRKINDSTYVNLYWVKGLPYQKGDTVKIPKTDTSVIKVHYPLISFNGDSLTVAVDSLPQLEYAPPGRDTSLWNDNTLIDKQYFNDRVSTLSGGGGTWGSITGTLSDQTDLQSALNAKQDALTLTTTGTSGAATLSGSTLNIPQYSGGGGGSATGVDSTNTATSAGQTVFTFPYTLTSFTVSKQVMRNGVVINPSDYTVNTGNITFTGFTCDSGDRIRFIGIK